MSRGLGDVYKRLEPDGVGAGFEPHAAANMTSAASKAAWGRRGLMVQA
jgi:hypothetical protein